MTVNLKKFPLVVTQVSDSQQCNIVCKGPIHPELGDEKCPKDEKKTDILGPFTKTEF
jgi:hypothetical protein